MCSLLQNYLVLMLRLIVFCFAQRSIEGMQTSAEKMRFLQQSIRTSNVKDYIVQRANRSRVDWFSGEWI